ncbi:MAG: HTH-type transcriptional activator IlvY [Gammaproteobacteria bacterium]|nr:HTH-type transcriptional activator IlvY [Gammaproteobacteria bacterium]
MDVRACQVFLKLSETLHFGQTAEECNLSPSAVSRLIQRLEQAVEQKLLQRDNRRVCLTPAGRHFQDYARKVVDDWQQLRRDFSQSEAELSGEVSVFGSVTASYSILNQILPTMRESYPGIEIKLRTGDQADGIERVLGGREDSAIVAMPDDFPDKLSFLPLRTTPLKLIGPNMPSASTRILDQCQTDGSDPDWSKVPIVLAERGLARERLLQQLQLFKCKPLIYAQVAGHEAVVSMVSLGFGIALVPELVIEHSPQRQNVRILPWLNDLPAFQLGLCAMHEHLDDPLLNAFWECVRQCRSLRG